MYRKYHIGYKPEMYVGYDVVLLWGCCLFCLISFLCYNSWDVSICGNFISGCRDWICGKISSFFKYLDLLYLHRFIIIITFTWDFTYFNFSQFRWYCFKGLIAIVWLGSPQPLAPTLTLYPICSKMTMCLLMSRNLLVIHLLQWRLWRLLVEIRVYKSFTNVLQKFVFCLNIFSNQTTI